MSNQWNCLEDLRKLDKKTSQVSCREFERLSEYDEGKRTKERAKASLYRWNKWPLEAGFAAVKMLIMMVTKGARRKEKTKR